MKLRRSGPGTFESAADTSLDPPSHFHSVIHFICFPPKSMDEDRVYSAQPGAQIKFQQASLDMKEQNASRSSDTPRIRGPTRNAPSTIDRSQARLFVQKEDTEQVGEL